MSPAAGNAQDGVARSSKTLRQETVSCHLRKRTGFCIKRLAGSVTIRPLPGRKTRLQCAGPTFEAWS